MRSAFAAAALFGAAIAGAVAPAYEADYTTSAAAATATYAPEYAASTPAAKASEAAPYYQPEASSSAEAAKPYYSSEEVVYSTSVEVKPSAKAEAPVYGTPAAAPYSVEVKPSEAAPYPIPSAKPVKPQASGVAKPSVYGTGALPKASGIPYTGAASSVQVGGLLAGAGAMVALLL